MKKTGLAVSLAVIMALLFAVSAWTQEITALDASQYDKKVDNFIIVMDTSETMGDMHNGTPKICIAGDIVDRMNRTIPDLDFTAGMRTFGRGYRLFSINQTDLIYGMTGYTKDGIACGLRKVTFACGNTPMSCAVNAASGDLETVQGDIAVIIVGDGLSTDDDPVCAARKMKERYGDRVCIYTILVGNDPRGLGTMKRIADAGKCGFLTVGDYLASRDRMVDFVKKVFLKPKAPEIKVKEPVVVEKIVLNAVNFDFDSAAIRTDSAVILDEAARILSTYPGKSIDVEGHTCSMGPAEYNKRLSQRRAESVKSYLTEKGIPSETMKPVGYGEERPIAENTTLQGRRKNRRVEFKIMQ